jgi:hypothetical protein
MAKSTKIFIAVLVLMILIPIAVQITKKINRDQHARYTIGITKGEAYASKGRHDISFSYSVQGNQYLMKNAYEYTANPNNARYFVKYDSLHPSNSSLLEDFPVPDSIKTAPPNGWKEMPVKKPEN